MKKILIFLTAFWGFTFYKSQELLAEVTINHQQIQGSNTEVFKKLQKSLKDFINNTSWTGKRLQNFEKIKCNFAIIVTSRDGNTFKSSLVVQATRPIYNSIYTSPLLNINDRDFSFEYSENENLVFNERQFSGKNLTDVISFYTYLILGYDADSFKSMSGQPWFDKAFKISQNSQNQRFTGWSITEGQRTRAQLIDNLIKQENNTLREIYYAYHRVGMDNLFRENASFAKKTIFDNLKKLSRYENNFMMNYPFSVFIQSKSNEIYDIFKSGNNTNINLSELKNLMTTFDPSKSDKWNQLR